MKSIAKWTWLLVLVAVLYSGFVLYQRRASTAALKEREAEAEQKRIDADAKLLDKLGGGALKILTFYPNPPAISAGAKGLLCYGVAGAKSVRIEPGVEPITPSLSRCVEVRPKATTEYKITAVDDKGQEQSQTAAVTVR